MNIAEVTNPDSLKTILRKLLRQESIDASVLITKWLLTAVATGTVTAVIVQMVNMHLSAQNQRSLFQQQIQKLNSTTQETDATAKPSYSLIAQKNIFGPLGQTNAAASKQKPATKLPLTLIGVFLEKGDLPYAIIEDDKKKVQDVFNIGDMVFGDAKLVTVRSDSVEIKRGSQIEVLSLDDNPDAKGGSSGSSSSGDGEEFTVDSKELDTALENLPLLLTQARAVPYFKDGKSVGLRLFSIKNGSLYEKVGLQNGDILKAINGSSLSDISQAMKLFETLKQEKSISVTLERNREEKEFKYQIK